MKIVLGIITALLFKPAFGVTNNYVCSTESVGLTFTRVMIIDRDNMRINGYRDGDISYIDGKPQRHFVKITETSSAETLISEEILPSGPATQTVKYVLNHASGELLAESGFLGSNYQSGPYKRSWRCVAASESEVGLARIRMADEKAREAKSQRELEQQFAEYKKRQEDREKESRKEDAEMERQREMYQREHERRMAQVRQEFNQAAANAAVSLSEGVNALAMANQARNDASTYQRQLEAERAQQASQRQQAYQQQLEQAKRAREEAERQQAVDRRQQEQAQRDQEDARREQEKIRISANLNVSNRGNAGDSSRLICQDITHSVPATASRPSGPGDCDGMVFVKLQNNSGQRAVCTLDFEDSRRGWGNSGIDAMAAGKSDSWWHCAGTGRYRYQCFAVPAGRSDWDCQSPKWEK